MADSGEDDEVGAGEGYAKYALSESDDKAHTAAQSARVWTRQLRGRTIRIGSSFNSIQQLHTRDIIDINLGFKNHNQPLSIHLDT
jgi:hypothetical protein